MSRERTEYYDVTIRVRARHDGSISRKHLMKQVIEVSTRCWAISSGGYSITKNKHPISIVRKK